MDMCDTNVNFNTREKWEELNDTRENWEGLNDTRENWEGLNDTREKWERLNIRENWRLNDTSKN